MTELEQLKAERDQLTRELAEARAEIARLKEHAISCGKLREEADGYKVRIAELEEHFQKVNDVIRRNAQTRKAI